MAIGEGVTTLGDNVFEGCAELGALFLPGSLTHLGQQNLDRFPLDYVYFGGTKSELIALGLNPSYYPNVTFEFGGSKSWSLENGTLTITADGYLGYMEELDDIKDEVKHLVVKPGVTVMGRMVDDWESLRTISLPEGLISIEEMAFNGCKGLYSISLPDSLQSMGGYLFTMCERFESLYIPISVKEIGKELFYRCPASITYDGSYEELAQIGMNPKDYPNTTFHFGKDPLYTITFDSNGGIVDTPSIAVREHNAYGNLPVPSHPEHRAFLGWYTQKEGGKLVQPSDFLTEYRDHTLYAHWHNKNTSALKPVAKGAKPDKLDGQPNAGYQSYKVWINWDETDCSYLYENEKGGLTRVQSTRAHRDAKVTDVLVEEYDKDNNVTATLHIEPELPIWGGFFCGEAYNFLFFGQRNDAEDDTAEVIRVVRYDKLWNRIDHASVGNVGLWSPLPEAGPFTRRRTASSLGIPPEECTRTKME